MMFMKHFIAFECLSGNSVGYRHWIKATFFGIDGEISIGSYTQPGFQSLH